MIDSRHKTKELDQANRAVECHQGHNCRDVADATAVLDEWVRKLAMSYDSEYLEEMCGICEETATVYEDALKHRHWCFIGNPSQPVISVTKAQELVREN